MNKYLIIRILGNDITTLHGKNQTFINLQFTLQYESNFENTDKLYVLNRIFDINKKNIIIKLLNEYNQKFIDIAFNYNELNKLPKIIETITLFKSYSFQKKCDLLYKHNLYIININKCRNYCINYGKKYYEWTFILDSNNFFIDSHYNSIIKNIEESNDYIIIPQIRLHDMKYSNKTLLKNSYLEDIDLLPLREPQIAVKNTSTIIFNKYIPYGLCDKSEYLNAIGVDGIWSTWDSFKILDIKQRNYKNINKLVISKIIRLSPFNNNNNIKKNNEGRIIGLFKIVKRLQSFKKNN